MEELETKVIKAYSENKIRNLYKESVKEGLWKSEELLIDKYFKKDSKILDIGCGTGRTTFQLAKKGYNIIGIDIVPVMIESAKELNKEFNARIEFKVMNATYLEFENETFDGAIFSFCGWDQIPKKENRLKALKEIYRVLKYYGHFILTSYSRGGLWPGNWFKIYLLKPLGFNVKEVEYGDIFFKKGGKEIYEGEQFIHFPTLSKVKKQIEEVGFKLVFSDRRNSIAYEDKKLDSGDCTFFVCKKNLEKQSSTF